jgi:hypothetical protein
MDYDTAINATARELRGFAAKEIHVNFGEGYFRHWAEDEGGVALGKEYQSTFKKHFGDRITTEIADALYVAGRSVGYLMVSLFDSDTDIDDMVRIVTSFVNEQVTSMDEWCDKLSNSFPETD